MAGDWFVISDDDMNRTVAKLPGVQAVLKETADSVGAVAKRQLDIKPKKRTGKSFIEVGRHLWDNFARYDWFVDLMDPTNETWPHGNAVAIEFGHRMGPEGQPNRPYVQGLRIMTHTYAIFAGRHLGGRG